MQIKATMRYQLEWPSTKSLQIINARVGVGKREPSYTVAVNVNWYSHYGLVWRFLKSLKTQLLYDPTGPLLGIYPGKNHTLKIFGTCTPMFIVALFTTAKTWKQPKCPVTDECIKKIYIYRVGQKVHLANPI